MLRQLLCYSLAVTLAMLGVGSLRAADLEPPDTLNQDRLIIEYHGDALHLSLNLNGAVRDVGVKCSDRRLGADRVQLGENLVFYSNELRWDTLVVPYELLKLVTVETRSMKRVLIIFRILDQPPAPGKLPTDLWSAFAPAVIDADRFIRGSVISVAAPIEIAGEVNRNVIALFGDVTLRTKAVVRGDLIAVCGRVHRQPDSRVYGQVISQRGRERGGRMFGSQRQGTRGLELTGTLDYNRVDGLYLGAGLKFQDPDRQLPSVHGEIGYAFEAERMKYMLAIAQRIFKYYAVEPYLRAYRVTATEDDWMSPRDENAAFALLINEDFRDYYEKEGGAVGLKIYLGTHHLFDFGYSYDRIHPLTAHRDLWSLFGKKQFRSNFSTLPQALKDEYAADFTSKLSLFTAAYTFDTRDNPRAPQAGWLGQARFEKAGGDLKGDFSYSRWQISLARFQPINRYLSAQGRIMYGGSTDRLPLFKKFFLGGLRSLPGYKPKVFYGDQMILANFEYLVKFSPGTTGVLFVDGGKTLGQKDNLFDDGEFKSEVGLGVILADGLRVDVARALDRSDADLKIWVTFANVFR